MKCKKCEYVLDNFVNNPYIFHNKNWTIWVCKKCGHEQTLTGEVKDKPYIIQPKEDNS